jgi:amino acid adenylation domain-containing protein
VAFNATAQDYARDAGIHHLFEAQAAKTPRALAVVDLKGEWSYAELNHRANQLARYLRKHGAGPETRVGICLDRSSDMLVALLGVLKAGSAYVPLDPAYPKDRIALVVEDSGMEILLTQAMLVRNLPASSARIIRLDADWSSMATEEGSNLGLALKPENLAYMIYTSGSTGKPKGVQIEHGNVVNFLASMQREPGFKADDVVLAVTTLSFDIAGLELYLPLISGGTVVIATREQAIDGTQLIALMRKHKVTVMQATPATWRLLLDAGWQGHPNLKVLCGGEALPRDLAEQLIPRCRELWNMYGPTETTIWSSVYRVVDVNWTNAPIGRPIANTQMYVLDKYGKPAPLGVPGELLIGGNGVARGYWNRPELNAEKFIPDLFRQSAGARLYRTGDLARYLPDGNLQYLSRMDNQVKLRGFRIELGEIEVLLARHPSVQQVTVIVREDTPGDQRLVAYIVPGSANNIVAAELRSHLKASLPEYMVPTAFVAMPRLPLTPNGKVDRRALPAPQYSAPTEKHVAARDEVEQQLVQIWEKVLRTSPIGVTDNFFEIGGHSLMAVRLMSEIQKATGKSLPLASLFQGATIEALAQIIRDGVAAPEQIVTEVQRGSGKNPFFAIVVPGVNALGYINLARHLGPDEPLYKIQGPGPKLRGRPYTANEFEAMAADYIRAMKTVQPHGPYCLGGMCEGARIAFDMARLLEAQGEQVALLGIFDTWVLENSQIRWLWKINYYHLRLKGLVRMSPKEAWETVTTTMDRMLTGKRTRSLWPDTYWPGEQYVPPKFGGKITLFKLPRQPYFYVDDPYMGWGQRCLGGVEIQFIRSKHLRLLREPYVRDLAEKLREHLRRARGEAASVSPPTAPLNQEELLSVGARTP